MSHLLRLTASLAALALAAAPANAATILVSFAGSGLTVTDSAGGDTPASVQGSILIDTARLPANAAGPDAFEYETLDAPFFTTTLTFSGSVSPAYGGSLLVSNLLRGAFGANGYYELGDNRFAQFDYPNSAESSQLSLIFNGDTARQVVDGALLPVFAVDQLLVFTAFSQRNGFDAGAPSDVRTITAQGTVRVTAVTLGQSAPVPEPATWATLTLGFGLVGAAVRRRRGAALA